ncbi:MAG: ISL3 family transposase, partial [Planctomycetota bacterium]
ACSLGCMESRDIYSQVLGLQEPWSVSSVELDAREEEVRVRIEVDQGVCLPCPECKAECGGQDRRERKWRHLDTCEYRTVIIADVPRVRCPEHGVRQVTVPWGDPGSRFTAAFEAYAIGWLLEAPVAAVSRRLRVSWDQVDGIMQRAVQRGLARRDELAPRRIAVDETSFRKRHDYVTVVTDIDTGAVRYVADNRRTESLMDFFDQFDPSELVEIEAVSMDMWKPYIAATAHFLPRADEKICFDRFHVAKHLGDAVDRTRRGEHKALMAEGDRTLVGTKYTWLRNVGHLEASTRRGFEAIRRVAIKTARAWSIREAAKGLWSYKSRTWAKKAWDRWLAWARRCRLPHVVRVAKMVSEHFYGILNAVVLGVTNAVAESVNSKIQRVKRMACGFRNRERFKTAIYFHLGGLNLTPSSHTKP